MIAIKVALSIMGLLLSVLVYTVAFAVVTCAIHGAKAIGWPALRNDPVYWLLLVLVFAGQDGSVGAGSCVDAIARV